MKEEDFEEEVKEIEDKVIDEKEPKKKSKKDVRVVDLLFRWIFTIFQLIIGLYIWAIFCDEIFISKKFIFFIPGLIYMLLVFFAILMIIPLRDKHFVKKSFPIVVRYVLFFILSFVSNYVYLFVIFRFSF